MRSWRTPWSRRKRSQRVAVRAAGGRSRHRLQRRRAGGFRRVLQDVLDVSRCARHVSGRSVREAGIPQRLGRQFLTHLARIAGERRYAYRVVGARLERAGHRLLQDVLGATPMDEWTVFRLTGESLQRLSGQRNGRRGRRPSRCPSASRLCRPRQSDTSYGRCP